MGIPFSAAEVLVTGFKWATAGGWLIGLREFVRACDRTQRPFPGIIAGTVAGGVPAFVLLTPHYAAAAMVTGAAAGGLLDLWEVIFRSLRAWNRTRKPWRESVPHFRVYWAKETRKPDAAEEEIERQYAEFRHGLQATDKEKEKTQEL